jgi:putative CocE/NonD family hydrolase
MEAGELFGVRVERNVLIPLSDGVSLAGDLFLPDAPGPFPGLVSYYPYHKDDLIGSLFDHPNRYFAARGYASILVDLRGLGNSEGIAWDVGDPREGTDGAEIVEWSASQSWCDGNVGMWGMSYGGFTSFKTAAVGPPHLKAIVPMNGGLDHYHDIIYPGGCFNCLGILGGWGPFMTAMNLTPPMYQDPDGRWFRLWKERLNAARAPYVMPYQEHPDYDEYWRSKTVAGERITVPAFLIGGWRDIFPEAMVRAYERVRGPRRLLMGPWMHEMPDLAGFAPVDYLAEMLRWWDCWLKGADNGVRDEPPVVVYVQGQGWRHESDWPIPRTRDSVSYLSLSETGSGRLVAELPINMNELSYVCDPTVGVTAGLWDPTGTGVGAPLDQGPDDLRSITFTGDPLLEPLEITGSPEATVYVALDEGSDMNLVVKLCDVTPDGHSALITTGWAKAKRQPSHHQAASSATGPLEFHVPLWATSYLVQSGHRLRLSVSCSDFPRIWPTRSNPQIRLATGGPMPSAIRIPVAPPSKSHGPDLPIPDPKVKRTPLDIEGVPRWQISRDLAAGTVAVSTGIRSAIQSTGRDGRYEIDRIGRASVSATRPDGARVEGEATIRLQTPQSSSVTVHSRIRITQDGQDFHASVAADGQIIFEHHWATELSAATDEINLDAGRKDVGARTGERSALDRSGGVRKRGKVRA